MSTPADPIIPVREREFRVAIVGGGICGLLCAIGLTKGGFEVDIFESASKYGEVGAGVGIGPNAVRVLKALGVLDEVIAHSDDSGPTMRSFRFIYGTGECETVYTYPTKEGDLGLGIHRAALLDGLIEKLDTARAHTHFDKRCTSIADGADEHKHRYTLHFADGTTHAADVVLGADGIRSTVRRFVVGDAVAERALAYTNTVAYRGLIDAKRLVELGVKTELTPLPICWIGESKHMITFPIKNNTMINVVAFVSDLTRPIGSTTLPPGTPWVTPVPQEELLAQYADWGADAQHILRCLEQPSKWSIHGVYPQLEHYVRGRVAVLGDAAHGMLPHLGAGVGQGIEDVYVLTRLLSHAQTTVSNVEAVLNAYNTVRVPRATFVSRESKRAGDIYDGHGKSGVSPDGIQGDVGLIWDEVWHHDLEADVRSAVRSLRAQGAFKEEKMERKKASGLLKRVWAWFKL